LAKILHIFCEAAELEGIAAKMQLLLFFCERDKYKKNFFFRSFVNLWLDGRCFYRNVSCHRACGQIQIQIQNSISISNSIPLCMRGTIKASSLVQIKEITP
jgi:hypothetical protein